MQRDLLFLLPPRFADAALDGAVFHCAACVHVEGLMACYPELRAQLDVRHVDYARPRADIVALLGDAHQNCPVLVLADASPSTSSHVQISEATDRRFVDGPVAISAYLADTFGIPHAHP